MRYDYECQSEECQILFEVEQSLKSKRLRKCPACGESTLERVILQAPLCFIERDVTTVGQLAERNNKKMGKEGVRATERAIADDMLRQRKENRALVEKNLPEGAKLVDINEGNETPWYGKLDKKAEQLIKSDPTGQKTHKYIMEGK